MGKATKGLPARVWKSYREAVDPLFAPVATGVAHATVSRLVGFWVTWHLMEGFDAMTAAGWSRGTVWKNRVEFRRVFGVEVEDAWPEYVKDVRRWADVGE
jgi:hypothetical protein